MIIMLLYVFDNLRRKVLSLHQFCRILAQVRRINLWTIYSYGLDFLLALPIPIEFAIIISLNYHYFEILLISKRNGHKRYSLLSINLWLRLFLFFRWGWSSFMMIVIFTPRSARFQFKHLIFKPLLNFLLVIECMILNVCVVKSYFTLLLILICDESGELLFKQFIL